MRAARNSEYLSFWETNVLTDHREIALKNIGCRPEATANSIAARKPLSDIFWLRLAPAQAASHASDPALFHRRITAALLLVTAQLHMK
ncbi:hypothetical protein PQR62_03815 [Herbaspirillum lusitanum]|uniref:Uncharacterized protein n=1 Tax=Herbaspirillum lusitanum TaxID=213312 RepID=A0ABW9A4M5_9BURK